MKGLRADNGCECVGYQAHEVQGHDHPTLALNRVVQSVQFTGILGSSGYSFRRTPARPTNWRKTGRDRVRIRPVLVPRADHGRRSGAGEEVQPAAPRPPSWVVSHELSLDDAPDAYEQFDMGIEDKGDAKGDKLRGKVE